MNFDRCLKGPFRSNSKIVPGGPGGLVATLAVLFLLQQCTKEKSGSGFPEHAANSGPQEHVAS
jgi:hypothetical protein